MKSQSAPLRWIALLAAMILLVACAEVATPTAMLPKATLMSPPATVEPSATSLSPTRAPLQETAAPPTAAATEPPAPTPLPRATIQVLPSLPSSPENAPRLIDRLEIGPGLPAVRNPIGAVRLGERVYVASRESHNVALVVSGQLQTVIDVGPSPVGIAAHQELGRVYVANEDDGTLSVLADDAVIESYELGFQPTSLAVVADELWVGSVLGESLTLLSARDGAPLGQVPLPRGEIIAQIEAGPGAELVYARTYGRLYAIDARARRVVAEVELGSLHGLAASPRGEVVFVTTYDANTRADTLRVLGARTLQPRQSVPVPGDSLGLILSPDGSRLYVLSAGANRVTLLDADNLKTLMIGAQAYGPQYGLLDDELGLLYAASAQGDSLALLDAGTLVSVGTIPLATHISGMAVDPLSGRLFASLGSGDRVLTFTERRSGAGWPAGPFPAEVGVLAGAGQVAVINRGAGELGLYDRDGRLLRAHPIQAQPRGLTVDEPTGRIYAGGTVIDLRRNEALGVSVSTGMGGQEAPVQVVLDTRRDRAYGVVYNGIPGSNGGYVVRDLDPSVSSQATAPFGRLSVVDALYDAELDRYCAIWVRWGAYGLQVVSAESGQELYDLRLDAQPVGMILNPATRHLWVVLQTLDASGEPVHVLRAYDTPAMAVAFEIPLPAAINALALDPLNHWIYLGSDAASALFVLQDSPMAPPLEARVLPTVTARPSVAPRPTPTCVAPVDDAFADAWEAAGGVPSLGCALAAASESDWALQTFERGVMLWRGDAGAIYALPEGSTMLTFQDVWRESLPALGCDASPPSGLQQPQRGFGLIWCTEPAVRERLGWAIEGERGFSGLYQPFVRGALIRAADEAILVLSSDGRWAQLSP